MSLSPLSLFFCFTLSAVNPSVGLFGSVILSLSTVTSIWALSYILCGFGEIFFAHLFF